MRVQHDGNGAKVENLSQKLKAVRFFLTTLVFFLEPVACRVGAPWTLCSFALRCVALPCDACKWESGRWSLLWISRWKGAWNDFKRWKKSLGAEFRMELPSRGLPSPLLWEALQKLNSLGKCAYELLCCCSYELLWCCCLAVILKMKKKDPPKYFFSIKGLLSTTKKDNSKEYPRQLFIINSRDHLVEELN